MSNPRAFYASPFAPEFRWIRNAVAKAARELGVELRAVDEVVQPGADIVSTIHSEIERADLAFAVITGFNPNVMYEVGRLLQASKPTILIVEKKSFPLPFDVRTFAAVTYDPAEDEEEDLSAVIARALAKVKEALELRKRQNLAATPVSPAALSGAHAKVAAFVSFDFELIRKQVLAQIGKTGCTTSEIKAIDDDSFKGWHQRLQCSSGDEILIVVDLNGQVVRTRVV
jgi:hypothetical protein